MAVHRSQSRAMKATLKLDPKAEEKFRLALSQIVGMAGKAKLRIMMEQMVLLVKDAMKLTPPFGDAPITEKLETQRDIGRNAVIGDLFGKADSIVYDRKNGIFIGMEAGRARNVEVAKSTGIAKLFVGKDGRVYGAEPQFWQPDASEGEIKDFHKKHKSERTGRTLSSGVRSARLGQYVLVKKMVVERNTIQRYVESVFERVLFAKSGWVYAWQKFQVALGRTTGGGFTKSGRERAEVGKGIPAPLRKLKPAQTGHYVNSGTEEKPVMEAGNVVPYAQRWVEHVISRAWNNRVRNIQKQAQIMAKELAESLRRKGINANA
jgi:hypothetical protein